MLKIDSSLTAASLLPAVERVHELSAAKVREIERTWQSADGSPVFTVGNEFTRTGVHGAQSAIACCLSVFLM